MDIIIKPKKLTVLKYKKGETELCLPFGSKTDIEYMKFSSGGGGTNAAATFALRGFKTAFYGMVGNDSAGKEIIRELKSLKVNTSFVFVEKEKPTNHSIIILDQESERTILAYRGAADLLDYINFKKLNAKWLYLAPLTGLLCKHFEGLVNFAFDNKIKLAVNPGIQQLSINNFSEIAKKIDVLILNQEEASFLTKIPAEHEREIFKKVDEMCPGVTVMTKGGEGVVVSDGKNVYSAKPNPGRKVVDTTGAGDSFASGFLSEFMRSADIGKSIQLGMANSEGNLAELGAKTGLLKRGQIFEKVKVEKREILK